MTNPQLFLSFLRTAIDPQAVCESVPNPDTLLEWFHVAKHQGVAGLLFEAFELLPDEVRNTTYYRTQAKNKLMAAAYYMERDGQDALHKAARLVASFDAAGIRTCVLKGQGNARLYPEMLRRQPGDIDLWVEGSRRATLRFLRGRCKVGDVVYHHCEAHIFDTPSVEVHFTPTWMFNPIDNARLQRYFRRNASAQFDNRIAELGFSVPSHSFNAVFQMVHIYRHLFDEGMNLKQLVDYRFLLQRLDAVQREEAYGELRHIGLGRFCGALMHVLGQTLSVPEGEMLCAPDSRRGEVVMAELMRSIEADAVSTDDGQQPVASGEGFFHRVARKSRHRAKFLRCFPSEVLWAPLFKTWQFFWRLFNGYFA